MPWSLLMSILCYSYNGPVGLIIVSLCGLYSSTKRFVPLIIMYERVTWCLYYSLLCYIRYNCSGFIEIPHLLGCVIQQTHYNPWYCQLIQSYCNINLKSSQIIMNSLMKCVVHVFMKFPTGSKLFPQWNWSVRRSQPSWKPHYPQGCLYP